MKGAFPNDRQGLLELIAASVSQVNTTYISFCSELEKAKYCQIHSLHNSENLLCLPLSCRQMLLHVEEEK